MDTFGGRAAGANTGQKSARPLLRPAADNEFLGALESVSGSIQDPVAKLRFIRESLEGYPGVDRCLRQVPSRPVRRVLYRWLGWEGLRRLLASGTSQTSIDRTTRLAVLGARAATAASILTLLAAAAGLAVGAHRLWRTEAAPVRADAPAGGPPEAAPPDFVTPGVAPSAIWMVERQPASEQFSNGLRIDTSFAVKGEPRKYRLFTETGELLDPLHEQPAGVLFHTSESDVWPLDASFNESLRDSSNRLLRYVQRHRLYHYLIDRFGRVYRVVEEDGKANHAGHSVWAQDGRVYLNLNHAFLGVSFETRWEGGRALPITQAQFAAGRNLTDYLRQRWAIPAAMCVTHGLTSVNPRKHLIGHHLDWARGFPFGALGLPDQYGRPAPSVALFGFGYDEDFLKILGEPWPGVRAAERALIREAAGQGRSVDEIRRDKRELYHRWLAELARREAAGPSERADGPPEGRPGG